MLSMFKRPAGSASAPQELAGPASVAFAESTARLEVARAQSEAAGARVEVARAALRVAIEAARGPRLALQGAHQEAASLEAELKTEERS